MTFEEDYLTLLGQVNDLASEVTGTGIVDAYFGLEHLSPVKIEDHLTPERILMNLDALIGTCKEIDLESICFDTV